MSAECRLSIPLVLPHDIAYKGGMGTDDDLSPSDFNRRASRREEQKGAESEKRDMPKLAGESPHASTKARSLARKLRIRVLLRPSRYRPDPG
jgi:hypothetical protein